MRIITHKSESFLAKPLSNMSAHERQPPFDAMVPRRGWCCRPLATLMLTRTRNRNWTNLQQKQQIHPASCCWRWRWWRRRRFHPPTTTTQREESQRIGPGLMRVEPGGMCTHQSWLHKQRAAAWSVGVGRSTEKRGLLLLPGDWGFTTGARRLLYVFLVFARPPRHATPAAAPASRKSCAHFMKCVARALLLFFRITLAQVCWASQCVRGGCDSSSVDLCMWVIFT